MSQTEPSKGALYAEIAKLRRDLAELKREKADLELLIETTIEHSDYLEEDLLNKVESALRETEKQFRLLSETIPVPIIVTRASDQIIVYANEPAASLFGFDIEVLTEQKKITDFYSPYDRELFLNILSQQGYINNYELQGKRSDGNPFWIALFVQPLTFNHEAALLSVLYDMTDRKLAEEERLHLEKQLRQAQKMEAIGTLSAGISHDFNNILAGIFGYVQLAQMELPVGSRTRDRLDKVMGAANRAKDLIKQILTFCHQSEQEKKPLQLSLVVKEALNLIRASLPTTILIRPNIVKTGYILADPTQIHQVLMNLCSNAANAMQKKGGVLDIILEEIILEKKKTAQILGLKPGSYLKLSVCDTGHGMSSEIIERIFDPFFTTKKLGEGTGMGLSVVHGIVKSHGGAIQIESSIGKGTRFYIYFPLIEPQRHEVEPKTTEPPLSCGYEQILLVDDDSTSLQVFKELLEHLGYTVIFTTSSLNALELFRSQSHKFDLVITDQVMPNMTGAELSKELLRIRPDIPIILCTGYSEQVRERDALKAGIRAFLMKPFSQNEIAQCIREVLDGEARNEK